MTVEIPSRPVYLVFVLCSVVHAAKAIEHGIPSEALATLAVICLGLTVLFFPEFACQRCHEGTKQSGLCDECRAPDDAQFQASLRSVAALTDAMLAAAAAHTAYSAVDVCLKHCLHEDECQYTHGVQHMR